MQNKAKSKQSNTKSLKQTPKPSKIEFKHSKTTKTNPPTHQNQICQRVTKSTTTNIHQPKHKKFKPKTDTQPNQNKKAKNKQNQQSTNTL